MLKIQYEQIKEKIIPAHKEEKEYLYCDKCGKEILKKFESYSSIRVYIDGEIYKERKYKYYKGYDLCGKFLENYLLPLLEKELNKKPNEYEEVYDYD